MAELDYAFLANYASVQEGTLTAVGASFCELRGKLPFRKNVALAGRVRAPSDATTFEISVEFEAPGDSPALEVSGLVTSENIDQRYADKVGVLFVISHELRLADAGICEVRIRLDGMLARTLKFEVIDLE